MNHESAVEGFLTDVVNLNATRLAQLTPRVTAIVSALCVDAEIGPMYRDHIPQGSWPHKTIIRPVTENDEFDADFLLELEPNLVWNLNPKTYLRELRAAFKRHTTYSGMVQKKNRCCRIDYANDCHVDVVPYLVLADGRQVIVNYAEDKFENTNPAGFTDWMKDKDDLACANLRKVVRLIKYLRDHKNTFDCPSVILTTLLGNVVQAYDAANRYSDVSLTFVNLLTDLEEWLALRPEMPYLEDPSCPGTSFNHRWTEAKYQNFKTCVARYAAWARAAISEEDYDLAAEAWQELFGPSFKKPPVLAGLKSLPSHATKAIVQRAPREQFIEEQLPFVGGYTATIEAHVVAKSGFRNGNLRAMKQVGKHRTIQFRLRTDVPHPDRVMWKVRNRGDEAARLGQLRGELIPDNGTLRHTEATLYPGKHYVEVYIIKNDVVVATDHHQVHIA